MPVTAPKSISFLLGGLVPDGGLYLPAEYPQVTGDMLDRWRKLLNSRVFPAHAGMFHHATKN